MKHAKRRHYDIAELEAVIKKLANAEPLEERYCDHALEGNMERLKTAAKMARLFQ